VRLMHVTMAVVLSATPAAAQSIGSLGDAAAAGKAKRATPDTPPDEAKAKTYTSADIKAVAATTIASVTAEELAAMSPATVPSDAPQRRVDYWQDRHSSLTMRLNYADKELFRRFEFTTRARTARALAPTIQAQAAATTIRDSATAEWQKAVADCDAILAEVPSLWDAAKRFGFDLGERPTVKTNCGLRP